MFKTIETDISTQITGWTQTHSNKILFYEQPDPDSITIEDISIALSRQVRWGGHGEFFYSVAQHSLYVAGQVSMENRIYGLLHDAHEAYTGDIPAPLKKLLGPRILEVEDTLQRAIYEALGIEWPSAEAQADVSKADKSLLAPEYAELFDEQLWRMTGVEPANVTIEQWPDCEYADDIFILYYATLEKRMVLKNARNN